MDGVNGLNPNADAGGISGGTDENLMSDDLDGDIVRQALQDSGLKSHSALGQLQYALVVVVVFTRYNSFFEFL